MLEVLEMVLRCSSGRGEPAEESRSDVHFGYGGGWSWEVELGAFFSFLNHFIFSHFQPRSCISGAPVFFFLSFLLFLLFIFFITGGFAGSNRVSYINM